MNTLDKIFALTFSFSLAASFLALIHINLYKGSAHTSIGFNNSFFVCFLFFLRTVKLVFENISMCVSRSERGVSNECLTPLGTHGDPRYASVIEKQNVLYFLSSFCFFPPIYSISMPIPSLPLSITPPTSPSSLPLLTSLYLWVGLHLP